MNKTVTEDQGTRQLRPVFYEPHHEAAVTEQVRLALALAGYELTRDDSWLTTTTGPQAMVTVEGDGSLTLHDGDVGTALPPVEEFETPSVYAFSIAAWLDGTADEVVDPSERDPERDEPVDVGAVREALECGEPIDHGIERAMLAVLDEVEALRAEVASLQEDTPAEPGEVWCSDEHYPWGNRRESIPVVSRDGLNFDLGAVQYDLDHGMKLHDSVLRVLAQFHVGPGQATTTEGYRRRLDATRGGVR